MKRLVMFIAMLTLAAGTLFAQGPGGMNLLGGGANNTSTTLMVSTKLGLFALRAGVLVKYDPATLEQKQILQLFGVAPTQPADQTDRTAMRAYMTEIRRRQAPALMLVKGDSLLIVIGNGFARISQDTLAVEAKADLTPPAKPGAADNAPIPGNPANPGGGPGNGGNGMGQPQEPAPAYVLTDTTLYLLRSKEVLSLSITDGQILARSELAKEMLPVQMPNMFGGRGGNGGGGNGGGGNGGGGNGGGGGGRGGNGGGGRGGNGGGAGGGGGAAPPAAN